MLENFIFPYENKSKIKFSIFPLETQILSFEKMAEIMVSVWPKIKPAKEKALENGTRWELKQGNLLSELIIRIELLVLGHENAFSEPEVRTFFNDNYEILLLDYFKANKDDPTNEEKCKIRILKSFAGSFKLFFSGISAKGTVLNYLETLMAFEKLIPLFFNFDDFCPKMEQFGEDFIHDTFGSELQSEFKEIQRSQHVQEMYKFRARKLKGIAINVII